MRAVLNLLCLGSLAAQEKHPTTVYKPLSALPPAGLLEQGGVFEASLVIPTDLSFTSYTLQILSQAKSRLSKKTLHTLHIGGKKLPNAKKVNLN